MQLLTNISIFLTFSLIPLLGGNHLPLPHITIDRFWIEGAFGFLLIIATTLSFLRNKEIGGGFFRYLSFFAPFFCVSVISLVYTWNAFGTFLWIGILVWAIGCVYLYGISPNKDICLMGLIFGAVFASISAILQLKFLFPTLATVFQHGVNAQILREQSGIPFASYMYHNILGGYLSLIFPLALYFGIYKKSLLSLGAAVIIVVGVVITSTRIGMGITIITSITTAIILVLERRKHDLVKLALVGILVGVSIWTVFHQWDESRDVGGAKLVILQKTKAVSADLSTLNTRTDIWKNALNAFRESPIAGYGAGAFEYAYRKYFDGNSYTGVAHSTLVKIAVEMGVMGLACFFLYLIGVGFAVKKRMKEQRPLFILVSLCAGFLFGLVDFSFDVKAHVLTFFLVGSMFFISDPDHSQNVRWKASGQRFGVFLVIVSCLMINLIFTIRVNEFKASLQSGDLLRGEGLQVNALYPYREATGLMPLSAEGFTRALSVLSEINQGEARQETKDAIVKEIEEYMNALEGNKDRDSEVYFVLGRSGALMGDKGKAEKYFRLALDYYPSSGYYVHEVAGYYAKNGSKDAAMKVIRSFDPYIEKHRGSHNPRGIYVYLIRDLEAQINYAQGDKVTALRIAQRNLQDANNGVYVLTSSRARNYRTGESLIKDLKKSVEKYDSKPTDES